MKMPLSSLLVMSALAACSSGPERMAMPGTSNLVTVEHPSRASVPPGPGGRTRFVMYREPHDGSAMRRYSVVSPGSRDNSFEPSEAQLEAEIATLKRLVREDERR
jgi:hypothetical protein